MMVIMPRNGDLLGKTWLPVRVHQSIHLRVNLCIGVTDWGYSFKLYCIRVFRQFIFLLNLLIYQMLAAIQYFPIEKC